MATTPTHEKSSKKERLVTKAYHRLVPAIVRELPCCLCMTTNTNKGEEVDDVGWQECSGKASHGSVHCMNVPQDSLPPPEYFTQCTVLHTALHLLLHLRLLVLKPSRCQHKQGLLAARQQRLPKCFQSMLWQQAARHHQVQDQVPIPKDCRKPLPAHSTCYEKMTVPRGRNVSTACIPSIGLSSTATDLFTQCHQARYVLHTQLVSPPLRSCCCCHSPLETHRSSSERS